MPVSVSAPQGPDKAGSRPSCSLNKPLCSILSEYGIHVYPLNSSHAVGQVVSWCAWMHHSNSELATASKTARDILILCSKGHAQLECLDR
jgi:hypothetical protein